MEDNREHNKHIDDLIYKVFQDDRNGAIIGQMRNAFRKVASAAMKDGYELGYESGFKHGVNTGRDSILTDTTLS